VKLIGVILLKPHRITFLLNMPIPLLPTLAEHLLAEPIPRFVYSDPLSSLDQIVAHFLVDGTVMGISLVIMYKMAQPFGSSPEFTAGSAADEGEILREFASRFDVNVQAVQVHFHKRDQAGEATVGLAVDDLVDGHELILVFDRAEGSSGSGWIRSVRA